MRKLLYSFLFILPFSLYAQDTAYELEGTVTNISSDSIISLTITVEPEAAPPIKQKVSVYNKIVSGNFTGSVGVADAEITSYANGKLTMQVLRYTSSIVKDGQRSPLIKLNNIALLKWEMPFVATYRSEHERADELMANRYYDDALRVMDSLYAVKPDIEVLYSRGVCQYNMSNYDRVVEDMNTLIRMDSGYVMAYYFRASAYMNMEDHEADALRDLDYVLAHKDFTDKDLEIQMRTEHIDLVKILHKNRRITDEEMRRKLCSDYKRLYKLDSFNIQYYSDKNCNCSRYNMSNPPMNYIPVKIITEEDFSLEMKILKKARYKWYNERHKLCQTISEGTYVFVDMITKNSSVNVALAEVVAVEGTTVKLKIEYWTVRMDDVPYVVPLANTDCIITW